MGRLGWWDVKTCAANLLGDWDRVKGKAGEGGSGQTGKKAQRRTHAPRARELNWP